MGDLKAIMNFLHAPSAMITFGGAFMVSLAMSSSIKEYFKNLSSIRLAFHTVQLDIEGTIRKIIDLANIARKEGMLSVEEAANGVEDQFLKKGLLLIVDGTDPELVRSILENEINCVDSRHRDVIGFWEGLSSMGPAWGMIGTLIGLINMLQNMSEDIDAVGPSMSVALVTTFYGSMLSNWLCTPIAEKLKKNNNNELMMKDIMVEGILSIQAGENPRVIEEKLKSFLDPQHQTNLNQGGEPVEE